MPFPPELLERYDLVHQGSQRRDDRRPVEDPARRAATRSALRSQQRAARATDEGRFEREIMPFASTAPTYVDRSGHPPEHDARGAGAAEARFKEDGKITAGNSLPDLRRRRRRAAHVAREGRRARPDAARADRRPDDRRRRSGDHADRPDPRDPQDPRAQRHDDRTTST